MEKAEVSIHQELVLLIQEVRVSKDHQEAELKASFQDLVHALSPLEVVKSSIHGLVNNKGIQFDLLKGGMNLGADFLIEKVFNKKGSIKGYLSSVLLEKVSSSLIQKHAGDMIVGIASVFKKKEKKEETN